MVDFLQRLCDVCAHDDDAQVVSTRSITLTVDGRQHRLDLCAEHLDGFWKPVAAVLDGAVTFTPGRPEPQPRKEKKLSEFECPDCGYACGYINVLSRHRRLEHNFEPYTTPRCPYCIRHDFPTTQQLSAHITSAHREAHVHRLTTERA